MQRYFNTAGPCREALHYMLPAADRVKHVRSLIDQQLYFVIHAPRQVGKTTSMMALAKELTDEGTYASVVLSCEQGAVFRNEVDRSEVALLDAWSEMAAEMLPPELCPPPPQNNTPGHRLRSFLKHWAAACPRPLVLFLDEIDALENDSLINLLRQLRAGYPSRPHAFPHSLALFGMRDVRDYKFLSGGSERLNTASPFNIKARSLILRSFNREEVLTLLRLHTEATGQVFDPAALESVWDLTRGQPWLTNALANVMVEELVPNRSLPIGLERVEEAKEILIKRRDTHLDSLGERLREPRVRRILAPMLSGDHLGELPSDDRRYVVELGLLDRGQGGALQIANPIYAQIIPRELTEGIEDSLGSVHPSWLTPTGTLDLARLQAAFLAFWREHGTVLLGASPYSEAAPQLVLMAFLHRVANGGGKIQREYAIGSGRLDLLLEFKGVKVAIECKVKRPRRQDPVEEGLSQLDRYLHGLSWPEGWEGSDTFQAWLFVTEQNPAWLESELPPPPVRAEWRLTPGKRKVLVIWG